MTSAKLAAGLGLLFLMSMPALAGGPTLPATEAPVVVAAEAPKPADPWTGPWAAVTLGSGRSTYDISGSAQAIGFPNPIPLDPGLGLGYPGPGISLDLPDFGGKGGVAGIEVGYDKRFGDKLVLGVQLGHATSAIDTDAALNLGFFLPLDLTYTYRASSTTSLLGRIGYLVNDKSMIFALAGLTRAQFEGDLSTGGGGGTSYGLSLEGVTLGAGIETKLTDKVSLRLDYRVTQFQDHELFDGFIGPIAAEANLESSMQTVNAAVVMHF
jgi:outer membrane immunogenic protein